MKEYENLFGEIIIDENSYDYRNDEVKFFAANHLKLGDMYIFKKEFDYNDLNIFLKKKSTIKENFSDTLKLNYTLVHNYLLARGGWTEEIMRYIYTEKLHCEKIKISNVTGDVLCKDKNNIIHFYEIKSSNELDKVKKRGEKDAFKRKLEKIRNEYPNNKIIATYFYRKEVKIRNNKENTEFVNYCKIDDNVCVKILYGNEIVENINYENAKFYFGVEQFLDDNDLMKCIKID